MTVPLLIAASTFFVSPKGNDAADGRSAAKAWRTLERASQATFQKGDRLVLSGRIAGPLRLSGAKGVTVASLGKARATIDGGAGDGIVVEGGANIRIENLLLVAGGRKANDGRGIALIGVKGVRVSNVDVSGYRLAGVEVNGCSAALLDHVLAHDNGSAGISVIGGYGGQPRSKDMTIRDCRALNNPGDPKNLTNHSGNGIVVGGVDGCLIEYCEAANNGWDMPRTGNGPVGIWAWNASRVTIQHCISHDNKSPGTDGGGFDLDGGVTDSVMQDNLSYGNMGAGYLLCQYDGGGVWKDNVVRNNVSFEDGSKNFHSGIALYVPDGMTNMAGALVEGNTIVNSRYAISTMGDIPGIVYRNNVFVSGDDMLNVAWGEAGFGKSTFRDNLAWSKGRPPFVGKHSPFSSLEDWKAVGGDYKDPLLLIPTSTKELPTDPRTLATMKWFKKREAL